MSSARLAQPVERKALNLVVVGLSPTVGVYNAHCTFSSFQCPVGRQVLLLFIFSNAQSAPVSIWAPRGFPDTVVESLGRGLEKEVRE